MTLRAALENPGDLFRPLRVHAPEVREIPRQTALIVDGGGTLKQSISVAEAQAQLIAAFHDERLDSLRRRDLRGAPRCFFDGPKPLAETPAVMQALLDRIADQQQKSAVLAAVLQYLEHFDPANPGLVKLGQWLDTVVRSWPWPWKERATQFRLFDVANAPARLAKEVLEGDMPSDKVLVEVGLPEAVAAGALGEAVFAAGCASVATLKGNAAMAPQQRLLSWGKRGDRFGYDRLFPEFTSALLSPFSQSEPSDEHRNRIMSELDAIAGDPRVRPAKWAGVQDRAPEAYATLLQWLTKASVYQFFDIVDRVAEQHMWRYRRAFWTAYLEAGHIDRAWVVFGANGARLAKQAAVQSGEKGLAQFGRLDSGGGKTPDHAALIMVIGDLTIAEWSHNGKYNIWRRGDRTTPKLFRSTYHPDELRNAPIDGSHTSADKFNWQRNVAAIIRSETLRSTPMNKWQPGAQRR